MSGVAPSTPTIPQLRPRLQDRPAGARFAHVHDVVRRPSRPGFWVRPGAPSDSVRVRARRRAAAWTTAWALGAALGLALLVAFVLQREAQHQLVAHSQAPVDYAALVEHIREAQIRPWRPIWRLRAGATRPDTRRQLDHLGVRVVDADRRFDAFLLRPGGVGPETGYAHLGGGRRGQIPTDAATFAQTAFARSAESWEPLGDGWYRVVGEW